METLELYDIDEDQLKGLLHEIPELWKENSGFFGTALIPIFQNFGEMDNLIFGVHVFSHANGGWILILLTEYLRDARIASFNISARNLVGWFAPSADKKGEIKFREILENLTYDELEIFAKENQYQEADTIFVCPNCSAQYLFRVLRVTRDGRIECQNCQRLFDPVELDVAQRTASHDS